jgi:membrane protease YdiL (CAAX protease family)
MNQSTLQEPVPTIGRRGAFFLLLPVVLAPTIGTLSALWFWPGPLGSSIYTVCKAILYGLPFILWLRVSTQERPSYKCSLKWILAGLGSGALIGLLILLVWFFLLESSTDTGPLLAVVEENGLDGAVKFWLFGAWLCLGNSFLEEFVFRWFVDGRLRQMGLGWNAVVPISAAIFTLHHVFVLSAYFGTSLTVFGSVGVFIGGILWSILRLKSMSLIPGWLSHALVDLAIILIGASVLNVWPYG